MQKIVSLSMAFILSLLGPVSASAMEEDSCLQCEHNEKYEFQYSINESDENWYEYSMNYKLEVCRIPAETVENASTEDLVELLLDYPVF